MNRTRLEQLADEGDRGARRVLRSVRRLSFELSGAQLGITLASLVVGFVGEPVLADLLNRVPGVELDEGSAPSVILALTLATVATMVFGELVPKSIAIARPLGTARLVVHPLGWFAALFGPLIRVLNGLANVVVRLFGVEPRDELEAARSLEEIEILFRASVERGALDAATLPLLTRTMSFGEKDAGEALVPRVALVALPAGASIAELARQAIASGHSRILVHEDDGSIDSVIGTVHVKDALRVPRDEWESTPLRGFVEDVPVAPESRGLESLLSELSATGRPLAVVVDEYGGTAGIVTVEDVIEEIVGEIEDEYDAAGSAPVSWAGMDAVSGMIHADEVLEATGFLMPEGDYETLAGLVLDRLARIPSAGDRVEVDGWVLEVTQMDGRRIDMVRVIAPATTPPADEEGP